MIGQCRRLKYYGANTSLHGIRYIFDENIPPCFRFIWLVIVILSFVGMLLIFKGNYESYTYNAISFVTETAYLDWNTTFPAISICELNNADITWTSDPRLGYSPMQQFITDLVFFTGSCYSCSTECKECQSVNFKDIVKRFRKPCNKLLKSCWWNNVKFDCCQKFLPIYTEYGVCYSINSLHTKWMAHTNNSQRIIFANRRSMGMDHVWTTQSFKTTKYLGVILDSKFTWANHLENAAEKDAIATKSLHYRKTIESEMMMYSNRKTGPGELLVQAIDDIRFYFHAPEDVPFINLDPDQRKDVMLGESHNITFNVIEIENDENVRHVPVEKRGCRFPWERPSELLVHEFYSYSSCIVQCHADAHLDLCNCTHHLMPAISKLIEGGWA